MPVDGGVHGGVYGGGRRRWTGAMDEGGALEGSGVARAV